MTRRPSEAARQFIALLIHKQLLFELVGGSRGNREAAALEADRFAAQQREAAQKVIEAIADMEGTEGMTDRIFAERALMLVNEHLRPDQKIAVAIDAERPAPEATPPSVRAY